MWQRSVLRCVALCCTVLQRNEYVACVALCCRDTASQMCVVECAAVYCRVLQCVAVTQNATGGVGVRCSVMQRIAACCSEL